MRALFFVARRRTGYPVVFWRLVRGMALRTILVLRQNVQRANKRRIVARHAARLLRRTFGARWRIWTVRAMAIPAI